METVKIKIVINKKEYSVPAGKPVLAICRENDIPIAALCGHPDFKKSEAVCRLCLVKVTIPGTDKEKFLPGCAAVAEEGMNIVTEDAEIGRIRKTILELLFLEHAGLCHNCYRNLNCELQNLAVKYSIDQFRFVPRVAEMESEEALERLRDRLSRKVFDIGNPSIARDNDKCVECRRCIKACAEIQKIKALNLQKRGIETGVGTEHYTPLECTYCGQCALHCPTAAIIEKTEMVSVVKALKDPTKILIAQIAPSVRVTLGEEFKMIPGTVVTGKIVTALKRCGFKYVFDVATGADFTIMEEASELIKRIKKESRESPLPQFTSCCPAWVLFVSQYYPHLLPHLSTTRSPEMMMGSLIKSYFAEKMKINPKNIVVVSIMPCTAKKYEAARAEYATHGVRDVDHVLTVRELGHIIRNLDIPFTELPEGEFDPAFGISSGSGVIFGASGGVTEAALRTASYFLTGKSLPKLEVKEMRGTEGIREASVKIADKKIKIGLVTGLGNARKVSEMVLKGKSDYDFIEVMACPGGCIGGGGQPWPVNESVRKSRAKSLYLSDKHLPVRESHKNPVVEQVYQEFLYQPGSRKAEKFLHTKHHPFEFKLRKEHMKV